MNKEIDKQKFMDFVSTAFDLGAKFEIGFFSGNFTEESAKELAEAFVEIVGGEVTERYSRDLASRWFRVCNQHYLAVWHQNSDDKKYLNEISKEEETA